MKKKAPTPPFKYKSKFIEKKAIKILINILSIHPIYFLPLSISTGLILSLLLKPRYDIQAYILTMTLFGALIPMIQTIINNHLFIEKDAYDLQQEIFQYLEKNNK